MSDLQRTPEWHQARVGKATASRMSDVCARTKTGYGAQREDYLWELVGERRTNSPNMERYVSPSMRIGTEREPAGLALYALEAIEDIQEVGFVDHPRIKMSGASPDRLVGTQGLAEIKCPKLKEHYRMVLGGNIQGGYMKQVQWQLACHPGRMWCDWISFHPAPPPQEQLVIIRVQRDDAMIAELEKEVIAFLGDVDTAMNALDRRLMVREAAE